MTDDKQILRPKAIKTIFRGVFCLALTIAGIMMTKDESLRGWLVASLFGILSLVFIIQLIPGSTQLTLTKEGFIITNLFRSKMTKWTDIKIFGIGIIGRNEAVMYDYVDTDTKHKVGKNIAKSFSNYHVALPSNYGLELSELLDLMNYWKNRYGA